MKEVRAFVSDNGVVHLDKAEAIRTDLRILLGSAQSINDVIEVLENKSSQVCGCLVELSKTKPAEVVQKTGT